MNTLYIILIILGYILMGVVASVSIHKIFTDQEKFDCVALGIIWPITISLVIIGVLSMLLTALVGLIAEGWDRLENKSDI